MKNGVRIGAVICLLMGVGFVALGFYLPQISHLPGVKVTAAPWGMYLGGGICIVTGLALFMFSFVMGSALGLSDPLLTTGQPATAVIKAVQETGISIQHGMYVILKFNLEVSPAMGSPYLVACRSTVPRIAMSMVGLGKTVAVKVDPQNPNRVAIDWSSLPPSPAPGNPSAFPGRSMS